MILPKRKRTRLTGYDYNKPGAYFITICTHNRECLLGNVVGQGLAPAEINLSWYGKIAKDQLLDLEKRYKSIKIDKYVIMPNHIHLIIRITERINAFPTKKYDISNVVGKFKALVMNKVKIMN